MIDKLLLSLGYQFSSYEVASEMLNILAFLKLNVKLIKIAGLSIRAGSRPKQPVTDQPLAGYFRLILLLILVRNLK